MLVLSKTYSYTGLHQDSPVGLGMGQSGGGWMYLAEGRKIWHFIDFEYTNMLFDTQKKCLHDLPISEMITMDDYELWGKVYQVCAEKGSFVYFPPGTNHRVTTLAKSIGYGGYVSLESDKPKIEKIQKFYSSHGCDPRLGLQFPQLGVDLN